MTTLNIDVENKLKIPLSSLIGESVAVLGIKGSGKTNTAAVLVEELLAANLPMTIVDIEGEYWGLKERFNVVVIGRSDNVDIAVGVEQAAQFAAYSVEHGLSLILDVSDYDPDETQAFLLAYFETLWQAAFKTRRPYEIILEEAHEFVPQGVRSPLKTVLTRIALRGRKRGLGLITVSQRSAKVEKDVLTQAAVVFLHRVVHPIDMKVYQDILPLPAREVDSRVGELRAGDALVLVDHAVHTAHIRLRHTYHAGATPGLDSSKSASLRADETLLAELRKLVATPAIDTAGNDATTQRLHADLARKDKLIGEQKAEITRLKEQLQKQSMPQLAQPSVVSQRQDKQAVAIKAQVMPATNGPVAPVAALKPAPLPNVDERIRVEKQRQQRRFEVMLQDLCKAKRFKRDMLIYLTEREGRFYSLKELAKALAVKESSISGDPPLELLTEGVLSRSKQRGAYAYISSARKHLAENYPDLPTDQLLAALIHALRTTR